MTPPVVVLGENPAAARRESNMLAAAFSEAPKAPEVVPAVVEEASSPVPRTRVAAVMPAVKPPAPAQVVIFEHPLGDLDVEVDDVVIGDYVILLLYPFGARLKFKPRPKQVFFIRYGGERYRVHCLQNSAPMSSRLFACQFLPLGRQLVDDLAPHDQNGQNNS